MVWPLPSFLDSSPARLSLAVSVLSLLLPLPRGFCTCSPSARHVQSSFCVVNPKPPLMSQFTGLFLKEGFPFLVSQVSISI